MTNPPAPDPEGTQPADWPNKHWAAYKVWATGGKRQDAALASGFSYGWVGTLVRQWKDNFDTNELTTHPHGFPPGAQALGIKASATSRHLAWLDRRHDLQTSISGTITNTRDLLDAFLAKVKDASEADGVIITPQDFRALTLGLKDLVGIADKLALDPSAGPADGPVVTINFGELPETVIAAIDSIDALPQRADVIDIELADEA